MHPYTNTETHSMSHYNSYVCSFFVSGYIYIRIMDVSMYVNTYLFKAISTV